MGRRRIWTTHRQMVHRNCMAIEQEIERFVARLRSGPSETVEVEYLGQYAIYGETVLSVPEPGLAAQWAASVVPMHFMPLYGLKVGEPALAGGLFDAAPFPLYDPGEPRWEWMNPPSSPEPIYAMGETSTGSSFWVSAEGLVYGHNLDNEVQRVGELNDFIRFAMTAIENGRNWYQLVGDEKVMRAGALEPIRTFY